MNDNFFGLDEEDKVSEETEKKVVDFEEVQKRKLPYHIWNVNGREYKLKLTAGEIVKVENKYKTNILNLVSVNGLPSLSVMLTITQAAMLKYHHGVKFLNVQDIFDQYCEAGGSQVNFMTDVLMPTLSVSGFFSEDQSEEISRKLKDKDSLD